MGYSDTLYQMGVPGRHGKEDLGVEPPATTWNCNGEYKGGDSAYCQITSVVVAAVVLIIRTQLKQCL